MLGGVLAEGAEQILRVLRRQPARRQDRAQRNAFRLAVVAAEQARLQRVEPRDLLVGRQGRVIGDIVGDAHELVERQDGRAMARGDQPGRDRKILVAMALAGTQLRGAAHGRLVAPRWTRPFQRPPRPRQC